MSWRASRGRTAEPADGPLLGSGLLRQLESLSLASLGAVMSLLEGEHPGAARARFAELSDYRGYQPGDDPRLIDWNAYGRLDELLVRTSAAHEGLLLTLLVDCSRSMAVPGDGRAGGPAGTKLRYAQRLAAALGAVALLHADAVRVCALAGGTARPGPVLSGRNALGRLLDELERLPGGGGTDLAGSLLAGLGGVRGAGDAGVPVLLSDLLVPAAQDAALDLLGPAATVVQVTDERRADPFHALPNGTAELLDSETGEVVTVDVTPALRRRYAERAAARGAEVAARCAAGGIGYLRADTATPVADLLFAALARR